MAKLFLEKIFTQIIFDKKHTKNYTLLTIKRLKNTFKKKKYRIGKKRTALFISGRTEISIENWLRGCRPEQALQNRSFFQCAQAAHAAPDRGEGSLPGAALLFAEPKDRRRKKIPKKKW